VCFICFLSEYSYEKEIIKNYRNIRKKYKFFYEPNSRIEFLPEEMRDSADNGLSIIKYSDICRILNDETHIYLMTGAFSGLILPFRCLNGKENELLSFIKQKMNDNNINQ
ncbi:MAG: YcxB family protein, partial [Neisseriaceae bacterium]|nr:YcxB family protein [Neisseriaceae bacterium]